MKRIRRIVIAVLIALVATPAAQAGGWWGPHYRGTVVHVGGYGPGYGPYATPWHVRRHHYRGGYYGHPHRYRHDNRGRYAAGGILLGLALGSALSNPGRESSNGGTFWTAASSGLMGERSRHAAPSLNRTSCPRSAIGSRVTARAGS